MSQATPKHATEFEYAGRHFACWQPHPPAAGWLVAVDDREPVLALAEGEVEAGDPDRLVARVREWYDRREP